MRCHLPCFVLCVVQLGSLAGACANEMPDALHCMGQVKDYSGPPRSILIDVGTADDFLEKQLKPENFANAAATHGGSSIKLQLRMQVCLLCRPFTKKMHPNC